MHITLTTTHQAPEPPDLAATSSALQQPQNTVEVTHDADRIAAADAAVVLGTGDLSHQAATVKSHRIAEQLERLLAGGRPVLALGAVALLLFEDPAAPEGTLAQWPGTIADNLTTGPITARCPEKSIFHDHLDGQTMQPTEALAAVGWDWPHQATALMPAPVVTWAGATPQQVLVVENGPLTAITVHPSARCELSLTLLSAWSQHWANATMAS